MAEQRPCPPRRVRWGGVAWGPCPRHRHRVTRGQGESGDETVAWLQRNCGELRMEEP
jgi:hypothetical protein